MTNNKISYLFGNEVDYNLSEDVVDRYVSVIVWGTVHTELEVSIRKIVHNKIRPMTMITIYNELDHDQD